MPEQNLLTRTLGLNASGKDVDGVKRTVYRALDQQDGGHRLRDHHNNRLVVRQRYGPFFALDVNRLKKQMGWKPNGKVEPSFFTAMAKKGYPDALAIDLLNQYQDEHKPPPPPPKYVEPKQGFGSLVRDLWEAYTLGRNAGLTDLGTYNPSSRLPSGGPSDHATSRKDGRIGEPACAFDLGFSPATGWDNPKARAFFHQMAGRPEVHYVILGNRIWSVEKGLHFYENSWDHAGHVHTSGYRR